MSCPLFFEVNVSVLCVHFSFIITFLYKGQFSRAYVQKFLLKWILKNYLYMCKFLDFEKIDKSLGETEGKQIDFNMDNNE